MSDEKEKPKEPITPTPPEDNPEEDEEKTTSMVEAAKKENDRYEVNLKKMENLTLRQERLAVERTLGGSTEAGQPEEKKEETPAEYSKRIMAGDHVEPKQSTA